MALALLLRTGIDRRGFPFHLDLLLLHLDLEFNVELFALAGSQG